MYVVKTNNVLGSEHLQFQQRETDVVQTSSYDQIQRLHRAILFKQNIIIIIIIIINNNSNNAALYIRFTM
jgi:hypothetical protein